LGSEFDVIIVGAGPAGSACALSLARKGINVLMLEKSKIPGERNMTGGVLYGSFTGNYGMINLVPDFESKAPVQRKVISHEVVVLGEPDWKKHECKYYRLDKKSLISKVGIVTLDFETGHDYSILRRQFDRWFAELAVSEGAMLSTETTVESLLVENGLVKGVVTTKETITADVVIDCSGVTSKLVEQVGLRKPLKPRQLYHGIKKVYRLDPDKINERFRVRDREGRAIFFMGSFMKGISGGAFLYTNKDTVSLGIVASMDSMIRETTENFQRVGKLLDVQEELENHPMVSELIEDAEFVEYSAHNIPKGYKCMLKKPYTDGFMVAGDALGSFVKISSMIDGMRRAIASGIMAAEAYLMAKISDSFRAANLSRYRELLSPIYEDVDRSGRDSFVTESYFAYNLMPKIILGSGIGVKRYRIKNEKQPRKERDAIQRIQECTGSLVYDEDREFSHIKVDESLASHSMTKPWVSACPTNCYTLLTEKGIFASYKDLYIYNLSKLKDEKKAYAETRLDIEKAELRFDHVACVSCGTCGVIGPPNIVMFSHERDGHGVRYKYG
jgi:electron transfer flavoprotein-quinone oxidoreductase